MTLDRLQELNKECHIAHKAISKARKPETKAAAQATYDALNAERQHLMDMLYPPLKR